MRCFKHNNGIEKPIASLGLAFLFLLLHASLANAQQLALNRVPLFEENVTGFITAIAQDAKGYMWFAGKNLYRYNGYHLVTFKNDPLDHRSISPSRLETIYIDRKGIIWIGTFGSGLDRYDPATGIFTHFPSNPGDPASLSNNIVTSIVEDNQGTLWVGTHGGLHRMNQKTGKFTRYQNNANVLTSLSNDQVRVLYKDRQGTIWAGCGSPYGNESPLGAGGLNRLDTKTGKFIRYMHDSRNPNSLSDNKVRAIYEDSRGVFWVGTYSDGLHTMDRRKGTFKRYLHDPSHPEKLSSPPRINGNYYGVSFIQEDSTGGIWIGAYFGGLTHFDPKTSKVTFYHANKDDPESLRENTSWFASSSRDGVMWVSTQSNVYRIDPSRKHIPHVNTGSQVNAFHEGNSGVLWLGTNNGLIRIGTNKEDTMYFVSDSRNAGSLSSNIVLSLYQDRKGKLWVGTANGLNLFNPQKNTFTRYQHNRKSSTTISEGSVLSIYEDRQGAFWVGTETGLDLMNRQTSWFEHYKHNSKDSNSLSNNTVKFIHEDRSGDFWIGTWSGGGINQFNRKTGKFKPYLKGSNVVNIFQDSDGILWVGTEFGLFRYNYSDDRFSHFSELGSEIGSANIVGILEDQQKNLWLGSQSVIFKLNSQRNKTSLYGNKYGVIASSLFDLVGYEKRNGELLFGNGTGYYAFFPDQIASNLKEPQVILTDFKFEDFTVKSTQGNPLVILIEKTKEIKLNYKQNIFSFEFAGIHYSSPEENRHLFMLENYEKNWRKAGSEKTAYYLNVPPGSYVFRVRASSSDGVWAEKAIKVIITPPWWHTWWAYALFTILFISLIWSIINYRNHTLIREKRILEEKVINRTAEVVQQKEEIAEQRDNLEQAFADLKTTQFQLIQQEKMASLGELTAGIAHEIQNPLNFVNNFSETNIELINEMKDELDTGNSEQALLIAEDIKGNEEKINHHGKRADAIVKNMLQHSRVNSGTKEPTEINALADEYLRLSYNGLRAKDESFNAILKTHFDPSIKTIEIVPQEIGRVLLNLFNNAFYAVNEKRKDNIFGYEPVVSVSTKRTDNKILITVKDNGGGIPETILAKIYQPFFTTKRTGEGTGLGLSLSYDIIKSHGGDLKVETKEGEGAEFVIQLSCK